MKKKWMFCLSAVLLTFAACSDDEKGTDEQPGPIIGEWVFEKNEVYRNGKLAESFTAVETADKMIAIFRSRRKPFRCGATMSIIPTVPTRRSVTQR